MSPARVTLWTRPSHLPLRLAIVDLDNPDINDQARQIAQRPRDLVVTPGAMRILGTIAGRRLAPSVRSVLLDSIEDALRGRLDNDSPESSDLLAPTVGEVMGSALLALHLDGDVEIIRVLESNQGKSPDFILLENSPSGLTPHLLECKGSSLDVHRLTSNVRNDGVCRLLDHRRADGLPQLTGFRPMTARLGHRIRVGGGGTSSLPALVPTENVAVTCLTDKRIVGSPACRGCLPSLGSQCRRSDCVACVDGGGGSSALVALLARRRRMPARFTNHAVEQFFHYYHRMLVAVWAGNGNALSDSLGGTLESLGGPFWSPSTLSFGLQLLTELLEYGSRNGVTPANMGQVERVEEYASTNAVRTRGYRQRRTRELAERLGRLEGTDFPSRHVSLEELGARWSDSRLSSEDEETTRMVFTEMIQGGLSVHGSATESDSTLLLRMVVDMSAPDAYIQLRTRVQILINTLRQQRPDLELPWLKEYVQLGERSLDLGYSWDEYPYPNPKRSPNGYLPGVTAWVGIDGRAEVVVRRLTPRDRLR